MLEQLSLNNRIPADGNWSPLGELDEVWEIWLWDPPDRAFADLAEMAGLRDLYMGGLWGRLPAGGGPTAPAPAQSV